MGMAVTQRQSSTCFVLLVALLFAAPPARAEFRDGLDVQVDTDWPTNLSGGYFPFRVTVRSERKEACRLTAVLTGDADRSVARVRRTVELAPGATTSFTLLWPVVDVANNIALTFAVDGRPLEIAPAGVALRSGSAWRTGGPERQPSILVVGPRPAQGVVDRLNEEFFRDPRLRGWGSSAPKDAIALTDGQRLPDVWQAYSGLGAVVMELDALAALPPAQRTALLNWVAAGGTLVLAGAPPWPAGRAALERLLGGRQIELERPEESGAGGEAAFHGLGRVILVQAAFMALAGGPTMGSLAAAPWPDAQVGEAVRAILAFGTNFEAKLGFAAAASPAEQRMRSYLGSHADDNGAFLASFAIPGVGQAPVRAFIVLMLLFTIVVGPVNFLLLARRKRQHWMLLTVPVLALAAVLAVVVYALLVEGLGIKGRAATVTWLDDSGQAVTLTRQALYAGWSPGAVRFEPQAAVFPISPGRPGSRQVDWTGEQVLGGSWVPSRTAVQWVTLAVEPARQRIIVQRKDGGYVLSNATGARLLRVQVQLSDERILEARNVADGAIVPLAEVPSRGGDGRPAAMLSETGVPLAGRVQLRPGRFIAETDRPLFAHSGPKNIAQREETHVLAGRFRAD